MKKIEKQLKKSAKLLPSMKREIVLADGIELLNKIHKNIFYKVAITALSIGICLGITVSVGAQVGEKVVSFFKNVTSTESTPTEQSSKSDISSEIIVEPTSSQEQVTSEAETSSNEEMSSEIEIPSKTETSSNQSTSSNQTTEVKYENTPLGKMEKGVEYFSYEFVGTITDWFVEGDLVHMVFKNANRYSVFDTGSGQKVFDYELNAKPAEIHNINNELWISYPDSRCIIIYDKQTFTIKNTIELQHKVLSFGVYKDYVVYTENRQNVIGYRYSMNTGQTDVIKPDFGQVSLDESDVLVNQKLGLVYICESGNTNSKVYCYDIETLKLKSESSKNKYGCLNSVRRSYLIGDSLYWSSYEIDATDVSKIKSQYQHTYATGMLYVNERFVVTNEGIYLRETQEPILLKSFNEYNSSVAITSSGNILITELGKLYIFSNDVLDFDGF